jgi:hypothetical protein
VVINKVGKNILVYVYLKETIREFCELNFHSAVLFKEDKFSQIVLNGHLLTAIATTKFWHSFCSDIAQLNSVYYHGID